MEKQRTTQQNRALHLFCRMLADELNSAGLDMKIVLKPEVAISWTDKTVKEYLWKPLMNALFLKDSTKEMTRQEPTEVWEHLNRHLGEKFGIRIPDFPSQENTEQYFKSLEKSDIIK